MSEVCPHCEEPILPGEDVAPINWDGQDRLLHSEYMVRHAGSARHWRGECSCYGGEDVDEEAGMTRREAARAALAAFQKRDFLMRHGS